MTVYRVVREFKTLGKVERKAHKTRSNKIRTPRFLTGLNRTIKANGGTSMIQLTAMREVSCRTIGRAVKEDLRYKSFHLRVRHLLTAKDKEKRVIRGKALISSLKSTGGSLWFISDEKLFNMDRTHNCQNTRWICQDAEDVPMVLKTEQDWPGSWSLAWSHQRGTSCHHTSSLWA